MADWLTREQIDQAIDNLSAADLIEGMGDSETRVVGTRMLVQAFDSAAARIGLSNGAPAMQHVKASDFKYLAQRAKEVINVDGPLPEEQES